MSSVYLFRHGQAGKRLQYDELSDLGRTQAAHLGRYLASQNIAFDAIYSGALRRQRETADEVADALGGRAPSIVIDPNWNEFDLDEVYRGISPLLSAADPKFQAEYAEQTRQMADESSPVHRTWSNCDTAVVRAWVAGQYSFGGESFDAFTARVRGCMPNFGPRESIAIFTSATPIAIWMGLALGIDGLKVMQLAGVMYNSAVTILRFRDREPRLFSYNGVPHLADPAMRSFR